MTIAQELAEAVERIDTVTESAKALISELAQRLSDVETSEDPSAALREIVESLNAEADELAAAVAAVNLPDVPGESVTPLPAEDTPGPDVVTDGPDVVEGDPGTPDGASDAPVENETPETVDLGDGHTQVVDDPSAPSESEVIEPDAEVADDEGPQPERPAPRDI